MRILHTADWHLGRTLHGESLEHATADFFDWLVSTVRQESVDLVLVAGDIYDRGVPPLWAVRALSEVLGRLAELTQVVVIPGNHDSATRLGFGAQLLAKSISICAEIGDVARPTLIESAGQSVLVYSIPYLDPDLARHQLAREDWLPERSHQGVVTAALDRIDADLRSRGADPKVGVIVMAHAFMAGGSTSDSERNIEVGGAAVVPAGVFDTLTKVDYVALGHLHRPQRVLGPVAEVRYSGSPIALSFSEVGGAKSVVVFDVEDGSVVDVRTLPTPVFRPLGVVAATMERLEAGEFADQADHWLSVSITDQSRPDQMVPRVRRLFPHALTIAHVPEGVRGPVQVAVVTRDIDPRQVVDQFFTDVGGRSLTGPEQSVIDALFSTLRQQEAS